MLSFSERNVSRDTFVRHVSRDTWLISFLNQQKIHDILYNLPLFPGMCY